MFTANEAELAEAQPVHSVGRLSPPWLISALALTVLTYAALAYGGVTLTKGDGRFAAVWLPNALAVATLLRLRPPYEPVFIGALFAGSLLGNYLAGGTSISAFGFSLANCAEIYVILWMLRKTGGRRLDMENMRDLMRFVAIAAGIAPLLSSAIASITLLSMGVDTLRPMLDWYLADAMGMMIVAPTTLILIDYFRGDLTPVPRNRLEWVGLTAGGFLVTVGVFWQSQYPLLFLIAPVLVIQAFRLGSLGTALAFVQIAVTATWFTAMGSGPVTLHTGSLDAQLLVLEAFLATGFAIGLPVAAAVAQEKKTYQKLQLQEEQLAILADNMSDAVMRYDLRGVCTYASASVRDVLGQSPEMFLGKGAAADVHPEAREEIAAVQTRLVSGLSDKERLTYRRVIDDDKGRPVFIEADCVLVRNNQSDNPETIIVSCRDVSERVRLEKKLVRARRHAENAAVAKSQFLANMSHEIRTPMNGVLGFVELLLQSDLPDEQRRHAELIQESGNSMMRLLNDILDISKIEAGQVAVTEEPVDLRALMSNCLTLHSANAEQKRLAMIEETDPDVPPALVSDTLRLRQIILNLLGNAVKFTREGTIKLSARVREDMVVIKVADSGVGIEKDRLEAIFNPFEQADNATSRKFGGTGLGLSISRRLAELLGGTLTAQSKPGTGSCFTLSIPLIVPDDAATSITPMAKAADPTNLIAGARILLAEDHDINRILVTTMLERCGQAVEIAEDGQQAVAAVMAAKAGGTPFDLVLMDVQMPECDGYTATGTLRCLGIDAEELPIIALTANAFEDDVRAARNAGMQGHLSKPLQFSELVETLQEWLPTIERVPENQPAVTIEAPTQAGSSTLESRWQQRRSEAVDAVSKALREGALEGETAEALARTVHKLAGTAGMFGEDELGRKAGALERGLKSTLPQEERAQLAQDLLDAA
ncbi:MASE1 domain-containing protein [Pontixanthobacter aestiaquae]|uniref:Sensory/regulatory protein RpfC n=1 Tax=Pontixanthobacter aestiaquae TaxID=1509367 RepID=A0A844ZA29_9SPHN|nr:MASE1 domain-containing protein [Pontixanthobacter aestiaquae]MDN3646280.1 MASE1 domain-containing protein [Pontixanthobacter aestiaquae]MXO82729.1 response regulator [Pontixanthobacter aestiaquae]